MGSALTHFRDYRIVEANEAGVATYALRDALQVTGHTDEAAAEVLALRQEVPGACIETAKSVLAIYKNTAQIEGVEQALRDAGLPEHQSS